MRCPFPLVLCLLCAHATTQTGVTAQCTALQPIVATWLNAPPNTPGASVSHPAGPLTSAQVRLAAQHASLRQGLTWELTLTNRIHVQT